MVGIQSKSQPIQLFCWGVVIWWMSMLAVFGEVVSLTNQEGKTIKASVLKYHPSDGQVELSMAERTYTVPMDTLDLESKLTVLMSKPAIDSFADVDLKITTPLVLSGCVLLVVVYVGFVLGAALADQSWDWRTHSFAFLGVAVVGVVSEVLERFISSLMAVNPQMVLVLAIVLGVSVIYAYGAVCNAIYRYGSWLRGFGLSLAASIVSFIGVVLVMAILYGIFAAMMERNPEALDAFVTNQILIPLGLM